MESLLLYPDSATGADNERSAMKITNLFTKGLVISAIASTLALGAGVAGALASDGQHERNTSGSEHEQGSDHGHDDDHDDDDHDDHGRGHESHGQGWGFGHGADEDNCDDEEGSEDTSDDSVDDSSDDDSAPVVTLPVTDTPVDSAPDTTVSTSEPTAEPTIENPAIVLEIPAVAAPSDFRVTNPAVVPTTEPISASPTSASPTSISPISTSPTSISPTTASPISNSPAATIQPQIVVEVPGVTGEPTTSPSLAGTVEAEATQQTAPSTSSSLPMTGASAMAVLGLAASLLAAGWLVIAGRRRHNNDVV